MTRSSFHCPQKACRTWIPQGWSHKGLLLLFPPILSEASHEDLDRLTSYAEKIGLAFQIKDDILSEEGDEKVLGKPVGNDKILKKCTYVSAYGLEEAKEKLDKLTKEAIEELKIYNEKAGFLVELAKYIEERNK